MASKELEEARWFLERGELKQALKRLHMARGKALGAQDIEVMREVVSAAERVQSQAAGRLRKGSDQLVDLARVNLAFLADLADKQSVPADVGDSTSEDSDAFKVRGRNGQLTVAPTKVIISREGTLGFVTHGHKGHKEIDLDQISAVQFKRNGLGTVGYIQFSFMGGSETKHGITDAVRDENSVLFNKSQEPGFVRAKELIDEYRTALRRPHTQSAAISVADELEKLAALKDKGILDAEEFDAQKRKLLGL
jgi:hypothetical protein